MLEWRAFYWGGSCYPSLAIGGIVLILQPHEIFLNITFLNCLDQNSNQINCMRRTLSCKRLKCGKKKYQSYCNTYFETMNLNQYYWYIREQSEHRENFVYFGLCVISSARNMRWTQKTAPRWTKPQRDPQKPHTSKICRLSQLTPCVKSPKPKGVTTSYPVHITCHSITVTHKEKPYGAHSLLWWWNAVFIFVL